MKPLALLLAFASLSLAQTAVPAPVPTAITVYPSYLVSIGGGYTRNNGAPNIAEGDVSFAWGLGGGNYLVTTVDMLASQSLIREGYEKILKCTGHVCLSARLDAGLSTSTPVIGSFAGGGIVRYDLGGITPRLAGMFASLEMRITGATTTATSTVIGTNAAGQTTTTTTSTVVGTAGLVTPGLYFSIGKSW